MDAATERALVGRVRAHQQAGHGTDTAPAEMRVPVDDFALTARVGAS